MMEISTFHTYYNEQQEQNDKIDKICKARGQQTCQFIPIQRLIPSEKVFFIVGDANINLTLDQDQSFYGQVNILKSYRPIISVQRDKDIKFLRMSYDNSSQGIQDFRFLTEYLKSMQNIEMYQLAQCLEQFQQKYDTFSQNKLERNIHTEERSKEVFNSFKEEKIKYILQDLIEKNPNLNIMYGLFERKNNVLDVRLKECGLNENFMNIIGSDMKTTEEFSIREKWFYGGLTKENVSTRAFIEKFYLRLNKQNEQSIDESGQAILKTIDKFDIPVKIYDKAYYLYNNRNVNYFCIEHVIPEMVDYIVGIFGVLIIEVDPQQIDYLNRMRQNNINNKIQNNILNEISEYSFTKYQHQIQSQHILNKYYSSEINEFQNLNMNQINKQKMCKFRAIR